DLTYIANTQEFSFHIYAGQESAARADRSPLRHRETNAGLRDHVSDLDPHARVDDLAGLRARLEALAEGVHPLRPPPHEVGAPGRGGEDRRGEGRAIPRAEARRGARDPEAQGRSREGRVQGEARRGALVRRGPAQPLAEGGDG